MGESRFSNTRWSDLGRRALSAALLAPVAVAGIWLGAAPYLALIALAGIGLSIEWVVLCGCKPAGWPGLAVPGLVVLGGLGTGLGQARLGMLVVLAGFALLWAMSGRAWVAAGVLYVGVSAVALIWLRQGSADAGRANVLFLVLVVWASDIGAYAAGRLVGGRKLAPRLSPGKTWAGAIGGLVAAALVGQIAASLLTGAPWGLAAVIALLLGAASQAGDLLESGIKRHFGVKDSGHLIPGHGGLFDRLDGLLAAAPAAAALAVMMGQGGLLWH